MNGGAGPDGGPEESTFQKVLRQLTADYARLLPQRLAELEDKLRQCEDMPASDERLLALQRALHTMAGSAGTFGLGALGEQARAVELLLVDLRQRGAGSAADLAPVAAPLRLLLRDARAP